MRKVLVLEDDVALLNCLKSQLRRVYSIIAVRSLRGFKAQAKTADAIVANTEIARSHAIPSVVQTLLQNGMLNSVPVILTVDDRKPGASMRLHEQLGKFAHEQLPERICFVRKSNPLGVESCLRNSWR